MPNGIGQAFSDWPVNWNSIGNLKSSPMLLNYIRIAFRNLAKNKLFSFINIAGIGISLACCFLIALFVHDELLFDRHHPDGDRTFRVYNIRESNDGETNYLPTVPVPFASYMENEFPEIESTLRIMDTYGEQMFEIGGKKIMESRGIYAEPAVFDMLTLHVTSGSATNAMERPNAVALSRSLAKKHFGEKDPLGEQFKISGSNYQVSAVFEDPDPHFHLKINYILSFSTISSQWAADRFENWQWQQIFTYLKLKPGTSAHELESRFPAFVEKFAYPKIRDVGFKYMPHLQNIQDIYLHSSRFEWEIAQRGNAQMVSILAVTGTVLLIIAGLNFVNLSTARAMRRMKEVGIRKVIGAFKTQLVIQFVAESVVLTMVGLAFATIISQMALPYLNVLADKNLIVKLTPALIGGIIVGGIILGICAGSYPAFYLSRFRPAAVLYQRYGHSLRPARLRQGLVLLQFIFSFCLIIGSMIVYSQQDLLHNKDLGFSKEHLVMIPLRRAQLEHYEATKREFTNHQGVVGATIGFGIPGDLIAGDEVVNPITNKTIPVSLFCIDYEYINTMGMKMASGREFSQNNPADKDHAFIINETAAKVLGYTLPESAVGKPLNWTMWGKDSLKRGEIIGVVHDFHTKSFREQLTPVVMHIYPDAFWKLTVRIKPTSIPETIAHLQRTYQRLDPEWPFTYSFVEKNFDDMYKSEEKLSKLFSIFTGVAIGIACLGLFGLVEYSVNQRAREISIRKVFGASVESLMIMLTQRYFLLVMVAFVLIIPLSYVLAQQWLSNFAYHITITPWIYLKALAVVAIITTFTVGFQSLKAALRNPANVLKNE